MISRAVASRISPQRSAKLATAMAVGVLLSAPLAAQEVNLDAAKQQFQTSCGVCHAAEPGAPPRQGPNLHGVFGRKSAGVAGFGYSDALKTADLTWDEATLDPWIANAQAVRPGTVMNYRQADPAKRKLIIAYLKSLSANP